MSRLAETFRALRARGERALVAYLTAGDPSLAETRRLVLEAARRGADVIELGVPFSDPIADGPVIQRAAMRALERGTSLARVLETVATLRGETRVPLVLLTYYNPVLAFGLKAFARTAAEAGVDGVIVADLPLEEAGPLAAEAEWGEGDHEVLDVVFQQAIVLPERGALSVQLHLNREGEEGTYRVKLCLAGEKAGETEPLALRDG